MDKERVRYPWMEYYVPVKICNSRNEFGAKD
jgi:hypothetical protein